MADENETYIVIRSATINYSSGTYYNSSRGKLKVPENASNDEALDGVTADFVIDYYQAGRFDSTIEFRNVQILDGEWQDVLDIDDFEWQLKIDVTKTSNAYSLQLTFAINLDELSAYLGSVPAIWFSESLKINLYPDYTSSSFYNSASQRLEVAFGTTATAIANTISVRIAIRKTETYSDGTASIVTDTEYNGSYTESPITYGGVTFSLSSAFENNSSSYTGGVQKLRITLITAGMPIYSTYSRTDVYEKAVQSYLLVNASANFVAGDNLELGSSASLNVVYSDQIVSISNSNISSYLVSKGCRIINGNFNQLYSPSTNIPVSNFFADGPVAIQYSFNDGTSFVQTIYITYYDPQLLIDRTAVPNQIISSGETITISGIVSYGQLHTNTSSQREVTIVDLSSVQQLSKSSFTYSEIGEQNGVPYAIEVTCVPSGSTQTLTGTFIVTLSQNVPTGLTVNGHDSTKRYYSGEQSYFKVPTFTLNSGATKLFSVYYQDGTTIDYDENEVTSIEYKKTALLSDEALEEDESIIEASTTQLYVHVTLTTGDVVAGPYDISQARKQDVVSSVAVSSQDFAVVLGNSFSDYLGNLLQLTATYENPLSDPVVNYVNGVTFDSPFNAPIMEAPSLGDWESVGIHIGSLPFTLDLSSLEFLVTTPDIDYVVIKNSSGIKPSYQNEIDHIDLSDVELEIHYEDSNYVKEHVKFSNTNTVSASTFHVDIKDLTTNTLLTITVSDIDGNNPLSLSAGTAVYNLAFLFTVYNEFKETSSVETTVNFLVVTLLKLTGLKIISAYKHYKIGETFLNDNDDTQVAMFYDVESNGVTVTEQAIIYLRDDLPTISVNYPKGTEWTQTDSSKRIVVSSVFDKNVNAEYTIDVVYDSFISGTETDNLVVIWQDSITLPSGGTYTEPNGILAIYAEEDTNEPSSLNGNIRTLKNPGAKQKGYIKNIFDTRYIDSQATMVLFEDYTPPIAGSSNITVLYPSYSGNADLINKCQFGILFGNNNATNRLFVSGNPDVVNADWHSGETNTVHSEGEVQKANGDFSYFPNENIMYYGETDNKIIGYDIVSNDKLFVIKNKSDKEKTVYFRTPTLLTALDSSGNTMTDIQGSTLYQEEFALVKGNNSVAGVSPHSIANLNGDTLFIDCDNTIQGLDLTGIIGDNQRYANSRSRYLDNILKDHNLEDSFLWTNNKYLFFPVKDVGLFVTHIDTFSSETRQYEWWLLQSENPTTFVEIDNKVYFGTEKGELYMMRNGRFEDEYKAFVNEGQGVVAIVNDGSSPKVIDGHVVPSESVVVSQDIYNELFPLDDDGNELKPYRDEDGNQLRHLFYRSLNTNNGYLHSMFYQIGIISNNPNDSNIDLQIIEDSGVHYLEIVGKVNGNIDFERQREIIGKIKENREYYLNYFVEAGPVTVQCNPTSDFCLNGSYNYYNVFRLKQVDWCERDRFLLEIFNESTQKWENIDLADLYKANLVAKLDGDYELYSVDRESCSFKLCDETGNIMNITRYGTQEETVTFSAEIIERRNVSSYYIPAPFIMGGLNYLKTIWQITLTNDTGQPSKYNLAIVSNKIPTVNTKTLASIASATIGTNYNEFSFNEVDFDKNATPRTYTIQRTIGMQKFVCFVFQNEDNTDSILSSVNVLYSIPFPSYGND